MSRAGRQGKLDQCLPWSGWQEQTMISIFRHVNLPRLKHCAPRSFWGYTCVRSNISGMAFSLVIAPHRRTHTQTLTKATPSLSPPAPHAHTQAPLFPFVDAHTDIRTRARTNTHDHSTLHNTHRHTDTHTHTHARAHAHTHTHRHARTHTRTHTQTRAHAHTHARTHARTHAHTHTHTHTRTTRSHILEVLRRGCIQIYEHEGALYTRLHCTHRHAYTRIRSHMLKVLKRFGQCHTHKVTDG